MDIWILKLHSDGSIAWQKTYGGSDEDMPHAIQQTRDGGYIVAGNTFSFGTSHGDFWVLRIDPDANVTWQKTYDGGWAYSTQETQDGGYIVAGNGHYDDFVVLKLNADGEISNCHAMGTSEAIVSNTPIIGQRSTASVLDTSVLALDTSAQIHDTAVKPDVICLSLPPDLDRDGLLNEVDPCPEDMDCDDDGLTDGPTGSEDLNANGIVDPGETDPANPDTDGDGIFDGTEFGLTEPEVIEGGLGGTELSAGYFIPDADPNTNTDPTNPDTDGDSLRDGEEDVNKNGAVDTGETSPVLADTDGDGYSDGEEVAMGTDPLDPSTIIKSYSLHLGYPIPIGNFNDDYDPGYSLAVNFDYHFTPKLSAIGILEYNQFNAETTSLSDTYWWNISVNLKYVFTTSPLKPYLNGGPGIYIKESGPTKPGFNIGLGIDYSLTPRWILEFGGDYHHVFTHGNDTQFFMPRIGMIYRF